MLQLKASADSDIGDSKSTTQKLSDETSAKTSSAQDSLSGATKNIQDTASQHTQKAGETAGGAQEQGKTYIEQAQDAVVSALNTASKAATGMSFGYPSRPSLSSSQILPTRPSTPSYL